MKILLCAFLTFWTVCQAQDKFNTLVDAIIYSMDENMIKNDQTVLHLPDVSQTFTKKVIFFTLDGSISVSGATVQNLSTIYRVGDVIPTTNTQTGAITIQGTFAMKELTAHVDSLEFKLNPIDINKEMNINIGNNAASFQITVTFQNNQCSTTLDYAQVTELSDFHLNFGGTDIISNIEDRVINFVADKLGPVIKSTINENLYPIVNNAIQGFDLCSKIPFLH